MKHKECVNMHYIAKVTHFITVIPEHFQFLPQVGSFLNNLNSSYLSRNSTQTLYFPLKTFCSFDLLSLGNMPSIWNWTFQVSLKILNAYCKPLSSLFQRWISLKAILYATHLEMILILVRNLSFLCRLGIQAHENHENL